MSSQWDEEEVHGEWISKEVYFKDGWPSVIRDPIRKWVGLTEDEIALIVGECAASHRHDDVSFAREIEAKLREKNT
jgi:hypothetical protein